MTDMIERLEKATQSDRFLNIAIKAAVDFDPAFLTNGLDLREAIARYPEDGSVERHFDVPNYTGSLDAATALAERLLPGWEWALFRYSAPGRGGRSTSTTRIFPHDGQQLGSGDCLGANAAIALCIAVLKAHCAQGESAARTG